MTNALTKINETDFKYLFEKQKPLRFEHQRAHNRIRMLAIHVLWPPPTQLVKYY